MLLVGAIVVLLVVGAPISLLLLTAGEDSCGAGGGGPAPSAAAQNGIPANYLEIYEATGEKYGLPWNLLAAIGSIETNHGRLDAPGVTSGVNTFGCCAGPMQFSVIAAANTWGAYAVDGNQDGRKSVYDPRDAIPSAAKYLKASGAPRDLHRAIFAFNHAEWYVQDVLAKMRAYASADTGTLLAANNTAGLASGSCDDGGGLMPIGDGTFTLAPGANAPGRPLTAQMTAFVRRMAGFYTGTLVVTTGTNHSTYSVSGNVSDHTGGNGVDFGMVLNNGTDDGPVGDRIAAAAYMAAGLPQDQALDRARAGGAQTVYTDKLRIQIIWKIGGEYGNHHNHVHVGLAAVV